MPKKEPFDFAVYAGLKKPPQKNEDGTDLHVDERMVKAIMCEIGLGFEPSWYDGASCLVTRRAAYEKLVRNLHRRHEAGEPTAPPIEQIFAQLASVITFEETNTPYRLHRTWKTAENVIRHHLRLHGAFMGRDRKIAIGEARREAEELMAGPQTKEEREKAERRKTVDDAAAEHKRKLYKGDRSGRRRH